MNDRNKPCPCGSGRKYKHCHLQIDEAPAESKYEAAQTVYARNWATTASAHYTARRYHWMAEQISPFRPERALDIGCGSGHGLLALFEICHELTRVISIEENGACMDVARATLVTAGIPVETIKRLQTILTPGGFDHNSSPIENPFNTRCMLIQSDVCNDKELETKLIEEPKFDAVTIWLTGTHMMRQDHAAVRARGIHADGAHRLYVQNAAYKLADRVLRPGGVLQVVDRGEAPSSELLRNDFLNAHRQQASVTSLDVTDLQYLIYEEPATNRTPMRFTPGKSGRVPEKYDPALISVLSLKP